MNQTSHSSIPLHESRAIVRYGPDIRVIAEIDQSICDYYRSLIPKYFNAIGQRYGAHITIVRTHKETPTILDYWGKHEGRVICFQYASCIHFDGRYFWLNAYSEEIGEIRKELGLPKFRDDSVFGGVVRSEYHITIANIKKTLM